MMPDPKVEHVKAHLHKPIVIIGMMGAGKTTLARKLAEILKWEFVDSDLEIEREEGVSIKSLFEEKGEAYFRAKEKDKIARLLNKGQKIVSVGGGAIMSPDTADNIFSKSVSLWVDAPIRTLVRRTSGHGTRPLLNGRDPEEALSERMEQRQHLYKQAKIHVDGSVDMDQVAHNAIGQIYNYLIEKADEI